MFHHIEGRWLKDVIWLLNLKIILIKSLKCIQSAVLNGKNWKEEENTIASLRWNEYVVNIIRKGK